MITPEIISYIRHQTNKNIPKDLIISKLIGVGWYKEDINEAFLSIEIENNKKDNLVNDKKAEKEESVEALNEPKIWIPQNPPTIDRKNTTAFKSEIKVKKEEENNSDNKKIEIQPIEIEGPHPKEDFIPRLIPKNQINSFDIVNKTETKKIIEENNTVPRKTNNFSMRDLPKRAMISSYESDIQSINKEENKIPVKKKKRSYKWLVFLSLFIIIIGLTHYLFSNNIIQIKNIEALFTKKNPKTLLIDNFKVFSSLSSYKSETEINISLPSFASITAGLMSGEAIYSSEKDYFSINTNTLVNRQMDSFFSDNNIKIKSSIFHSDINTNIKSNDDYIFVPVLDLSQILKENISEPIIVNIKDDQMNLIYPIVNDSIKLLLEKINIQKALSGHFSSNIGSGALSAYDQFINSVEIIKKGQESIKGISTYHYSINANRQSIKDLLNTFANEISSNISMVEKQNLEQIFGSITINSFDIWIGQKDEKIYQYNIILDIPLSKIFGFDDKSIGDNKMNIILKTTYFDFNIPNEIIIVEESVPFEVFLNKVMIQKIKKDTSNFEQIANNFKNIEGNYGLKSNPSGSCMNPTSGSLFSPTGHKSTSINAVSLISESINNILAMTNNLGFCYSTSKDWSFSVPLFDSNIEIESSLVEQVYFCVDSIGSRIEINSPPTGVACITSQ